MRTWNIVVAVILFSASALACEHFSGTYYCPSFGELTIHVRPTENGLRYTAAKNGVYALARHFDLNGIPHPDPIWSCAHQPGGVCNDKVMNIGRCDNANIYLEQVTKSDEVIGMTPDNRPIKQDVLIVETEELSLGADGRLTIHWKNKVTAGTKATPRSEDSGSYRCIRADAI